MDFLIKQASSIAGEMDLVIWIIALLTGFWLIVAELCLFGFIFKFRRKPGVKGQYITGEKKEEMKWIHLPHNLILICDVVILVFAVRLWYHVKQQLPAADETIQVIGQQWSWRFVHPGLDKQLGTADDVETVDELRVKVGKTYHFKLEAADVLHDFSIPVFRLKQDAIPGRVVTGWFKPTSVGQFDIQCAEMCGIGHGIMQAKLFVETESDHVKWLVKQGENQI
jgi:cytochrome c oxidase subunit 2